MKETKACIESSTAPALNCMVAYFIKFINDWKHLLCCHTGSTPPPLCTQSTGETPSRTRSPSPSMASMRSPEPASRVAEGAIHAVRLKQVSKTKRKKKTAAAIYEYHRASLKNISEERIREELIKFLCGKDVRRQLTANIDILGEVIPELLPMRGFDQKNDHHIYDVLEHTAAVVEAVEAQPRLRLAALFHDIGKPRRFSEDEEGTGHFSTRCTTATAMLLCPRCSLSI